MKITPIILLLVLLTACTTTKLDECDTFKPTIRGLCYAKYAIEDNNPTLCQKLEQGHSKNKCLNALATALKDKKFCNEITDDEMKQECLE